MSWKVTILVMVGIPALAFWIRAIRGLVHLKHSRALRQRLARRAEMGALWLLAVARLRRLRGARTLARQWDWERTIGVPMSEVRR